MAISIALFTTILVAASRRTLRRLLPNSKYGRLMGAAVALIGAVRGGMLYVNLLANMMTASILGLGRGADRRDDAGHGA